MAATPKMRAINAKLWKTDAKRGRFTASVGPLELNVYEDSSDGKSVFNWWITTTSSTYNLVEGSESDADAAKYDCRMAALKIAIDIIDVLGRSS